MSLLLAPEGVAGALSLSAPPDSVLVAMSYSRVLESSNAVWVTRLVAGGETKEQCVRPNDADKCGNADTADVLQPFGFPIGTRQVRVEIVCAPTFGGNKCAYGAGVYPDAAAVLYRADVTIEENTRPTVTASAPAGLPASGWVGDSTQVSFAGSDQLGLRSLVLGDPGGIARAVAGTCVDWSVYPCAEQEAGGSVGLGGTATAAQLRALGDGTHELRATATDAAGNVQVSDPPVTIRVDTTAPLAQSLAGGGLSTQQTRTLAWVVPAGGSPVVGARVKLCDGAAPSASACTWQAAPVAGPFTFDLDAPVSAANAQLELTDAAGNVATTGALTYSRDAVAPAAPKLTLVAADGPKRRFAIDTDDASVTTELPRFCRNDVCVDLTARAIGNQVEVTLPGAGSYRFEAALRDAAGNLGPAASTSFVVDPDAGPSPGPSPGTGAGPSPGSSPGPGPPLKTTPPRSSALAANFPKHLGPTTLLLRGTVAARSSSTVTVTLVGRNTMGRRVTTTRSVRPALNGDWLLRARLPSHVRRARGVLITVTAHPNAGFATSSQQKRVRG